MEPSKPTEISTLIYTVGFKLGFKLIQDSGLQIGREEFHCISAGKLCTTQLDRFRSPKMHCIHLLVDNEILRTTRMRVRGN